VALKDFKMMQWLWILLFGMVGVGSRFGIDKWMMRWDFSFPLGTLVINIAGCLIAGICFGLTKDLGAHPVRLAIIVGFCGGFTTFSGFGLQIMQMIESERFMASVLYGVGTPVLCVMATGLGLFLVRV
jgi:fluoride exporter